MANYGGNIIRNWDKDTSERQEFASGPYEYFLQVVFLSYRIILLELPEYVLSAYGFLLPSTGNIHRELIEDMPYVLITKKEKILKREKKE